MGSKRSFRATKNFVAGLMFTLFGLLGVALSWPLDAGTPGDMGPGYFPRGVCILLIMLGGALSAIDLMQEGERIEGWAWKPLILVTLSSLAFAFLLKPVGLIGTLIVTTVSQRREYVAAPRRAQCAGGHHDPHQCRHLRVCLENADPAVAVGVLT